MKISVSMITFNEEKKLETTLASVSGWVDEIVIVDSGSTDQTPAIAEKYKAKFFIEKWKGFGKQKNSAIEKCSGDWLLLIDADEEITPKLRQEIVQTLKNPQFDVYEISRISWCFQQKTHHRDSTIRLVKKGSGHFNFKNVHEDFVTACKIGHLKNPLNHHTYWDLTEYLEKFNRYTSLAALDLHKKGKTVSLFRLIWNPFLKFWKKYLFKGGIIDGVNGFILSALSAFYNFMKYAKLHELNRTKKP